MPSQQIYFSLNRFHKNQFSHFPSVIAWSQFATGSKHLEVPNWSLKTAPFHSSITLHAHAVTIWDSLHFIFSMPGKPEFQTSSLQASSIWPSLFTSNPVPPRDIRLCRVGRPLAGDMKETPCILLAQRRPATRIVMFKQARKPLIFRYRFGLVTRLIYYRKSFQKVIITAFRKSSVCPAPFISPVVLVFLSIDDIPIRH